MRCAANVIGRFFRLMLRSEVTIAAILVGAMAYKIRIMQPRATDSIHLAVVQHDLGIFSAILILFAAGGVLARRKVGTAGVMLSRFSLSVCLLIVLLYLTDVFIFYFFGTRLYLADIVTFSSEQDAAISLLGTAGRVIADLPLWKSVAIIGATLLLLRASYVLISRPARPEVYCRSVLAVAVVSAALYLVPAPGFVYSFGDKPLFENFVERNRDFLVDSNFSDGFREQLLSAPPLPDTCDSGRHRVLNVILVIVESLSAYHSNFFSGIEDWTPNLDAIAKRETALTNFHANGWTTIGGLISLLGGEFPFVPEKAAFNHWGSARLADYHDLQRPLASMLANQGYATVFLSAGDLNFLGQGDWLTGMGFQKLIGHDDVRFAKQKVRGPFQSVPDKVLYEEALNELGLMPTDQPFFMVIQTFWSHRPFLAPDGSKLHGEEPVIRETDAQLGALYQRLMSAGFFNNGLLFITGDHRAMEPFRKAEFKRFGASAITRIPGVIVTRAITLPKAIEEDFQQRDLRASIESLVSQEYCLGPYEGSFLADRPAPGRCVMHARGDDRDLIFVKCGSKEGTIRVAGDATRVVSGDVVDDWSVVRTVNVTRIRASSRR